MHDPIPSALDQQTTAVRLGGSHGYRIDGDLAAINAELSFADALGAPAAQHWALQLWACDEPYGGGALLGFKVAEAPIALSAELPRSQLDAVAFAHPPAAPRDYSMVLVLAGGQPGAFDQVHDFANYPARERFLAPQLQGDVGYELLPDGKVALRAERVSNPRAETNVSGSLALQLWVTAEPYRGGSLAGTMVASAALGRVHGQSWIEPGEQVVSLGSAAAAGHAVLILREWTAEGYLTRDYRNLPAPDAAAAEPAAAPAEAEGVAAVAPSTEPCAVANAAPAVEPSTIEEPSAREEPSAAAAVPAAAEELSAAPAPAAIEAPPVEAARLSLNRASVEELVRATGISKKLAADVIRARPFRSFDELTRVRGIGEKTARKFRGVLTL